jgi:hypothetical protein
VAKLPVKLTPDEINAILEEHRLNEQLRCARLKPYMRFEYQVVEKLVEVLRNRVA